MTMFKYHVDGSVPTNNNVFVFGSNARGAHGKGSALEACNRFGYPYSKYVGFNQNQFGRAYAIPTKGEKLEILPLNEIKVYIDDFIEFAKEHPELEFFVTRIGCGLANYDDIEIAPLFAASPLNCSFAESWFKYLE